MSTATPITRSSRRLDLDAAAGQTVFTLADVPVYDAADVAVFTRTAPDTAFVPVETGWTAALSGPAPATASVTFTTAPRPGAGDPQVTVRVQSARVQQRTSNVTRAGTIASALLEQDLDTQSTVLQELRRDINDASATLDSVDAVANAAAEAVATATTAASAASSAAATATAAAGDATAVLAASLTKAANLGDVPDKPAAREALGLVIGTDVPAYDDARITGAAPIESPAFTGEPAAPTPASDDASTKLATTAFVAGRITYLRGTPLRVVYELGGRQDYSSPQAAADYLAANATGDEMGILQLGPDKLDLSTDGMLKMPPNTILQGCGKNETRLYNNSGSRNTAITDVTDPAYNNATVFCNGDNTDVVDLAMLTSGNVAHDTLVFTGYGHDFTHLNVYFAATVVGGVQVPVAGQGLARCIRGVDANAALFDSVLTNRAAADTDNTESHLYENVFDMHHRQGFYDDYYINRATAAVMRFLHCTDFHLNMSLIRNKGVESARNAIVDNTGDATRAFFRAGPNDWAGTRLCEIIGNTDANFYEGSVPAILLSSGAGRYLMRADAIAKRAQALDAYTWLNQGSASSQLLPDGSLFIAAQGEAGLALRGLYRAAPGANWYCIAEIDTRANYNKNYLNMGIFARNSTTGALYCFCRQMMGDGPGIRVFTMTDANTFGAEVAFEKIGSGPDQLNIAFNAGTMDFNLWKNGVFMDTFYTVGGLSGYDQFGVMIAPLNAAVPNRPASFSVPDLNYGAL